jgi:AcrR family transcriptional regulator
MTMSRAQLTNQLPRSSVKSTKNVNVKHRLLQASIHLFADRGFDGVAVDEIVAEAGVNKRMVYHYFGSKEGIYSAVLEQAYEGLRASEEKFFTPRTMSSKPRKAVKDLVRLYFDFLRRNPDFVRLLLWENLQRGTHIGKTGPNVTKSPMLAHLQTLLDAGVAAGSFRRNLDARLVLVSLIGLCLVYFSNRHTLARTVGLDVSVPQIMNNAIEVTTSIFLVGICKRL